MPIIGPYAAPKMALEGLADALRLELRPQGVEVTIIQPGPIETAMLERSIREAEERFDEIAPEASVLYRTMLEAARASALGSEQVMLPPGEVIRVVLRALSATARPPAVHGPPRRLAVPADDQPGPGPAPRRDHPARAGALSAALSARS